MPLIQPIPSSWWLPVLPFLPTATCFCKLSYLWKKIIKPQLKKKKTEDLLKINLLSFVFYSEETSVCKLHIFFLTVQDKSQIHQKLFTSANTGDNLFLQVVREHKKPGICAKTFHIPSSTITPSTSPSSGPDWTFNYPQNGWNLKSISAFNICWVLTIQRWNSCMSPADRITI